MTQEKDKTKPPTQTICAGSRIAYDFPIRYAPNRVVRFKALRGFLVKYTRGICRSIGAYFSK